MACLNPDCMASERRAHNSSARLGTSSRIAPDKAKVQVKVFPQAFKAAPPHNRTPDRGMYRVPAEVLIRSDLKRLVGLRGVLCSQLTNAMPPVIAEIVIVRKLLRYGSVDAIDANLWDVLVQHLATLFVMTSRPVPGAVKRIRLAVKLDK